ncbi:hypothetical protein AAOGI_41440 [Agarivorans albus]
MKAISFGLFSLLFSSTSFANSPFGPVEVLSVSVSDANMLVVSIADNGERKHTETCDANRSRSLVINPQSPYEKEMFSIALTAKASGKKITGWVNGCHAFWSYKAPKLTVISIVE